MLVENGNYTERQKNIIKKLGKEHRENIDKDKKKNILHKLYFILFSICCGVLVVVFNQEYIILVGFFITLNFIFLPINISKKNKQLNKLKEENDYTIGLFYADSDPKIKGNANKKLKAQKIPSIVLTICGFTMAVLILFISLNDESTDYSSLTTVQGVIKEAKYNGGKDKEIEITFLNDDITYVVTSTYVDEFDWDEFYGVADKEHTMTLYCDKVYNDNYRNVYYAEINGVELLTEEEVLIADADNNKLGSILCIIFGIGTVIALSSYPIYKSIIYPKNKSKEIYDLEFTDEEFKEIEDKNIDYIDIIENPTYIKTSYPKWVLIFYLVFGIMGIGFMIGSFFSKETSDFWSILFIGLFFVLITVIGLIDLTKNFEELNGDTLTVNRFFKKKIIMVKDIKAINTNAQYTVFVDRNGKTLCRISSMTKGLNDIVETLQKRGILTDILNT